MNKVKTFITVKLRPYITGMLPLFVIAHFGHHIVSGMLRPLIPMIRTDFGLNYTQSGFIMSAFSMTNGVSQLPSGWLADRVGTRVMVLVGVSGVALVGLLIGFSSSYVALIALLVLAAILGGGYHPSASAAISRSVDPEYRGRAMGIHFIGGSSAFWIIPLMATPIAVTWGWQSAYMVLTVPIFILGILIFIRMRRQKQGGVVKSETTRESVVKTSAGGGWRQLVPFMILSISCAVMTQSITAFLALYAVDNLGVSEATAALLTAISPASGFIAAPVGGYLSDRFGGIRVLVATSFVIIPLVYLLGVVPTIASLAVVIAVIGVANNMRNPTSESYIAGNSSERRRATVLGMYFFAGTEGSALLTPVIGNLIDRFGFYDTIKAVTITMAAIAVVCYILMFLWRKREGQHYPGGFADNGYG